MSDDEETIVCPCCDTIVHRSVGDNFDADDDHAEIVCECGGAFILTRIVTYVARPVDES